MNNVKKIFCSGLLFLLFFAMPLYVFGQYRATAPRIQQAPAPKVQPAPKIHVSPQRSQVWNDAMKALEKGDMAAYNKLNQQYIQMGKEQTAGPPAPAAPAPGIHAPPAVPSAAAVSPIMPSWGMPMPVSPAPASHGTTASAPSSAPSAPGELSTAPTWNTSSPAQMSAVTNAPPALSSAPVWNTPAQAPAAPVSSAASLAPVSATAQPSSPASLPGAPTWSTSSPAPAAAAAISWAASKTLNTMPVWTTDSIMQDDASLKPIVEMSSSAGAVTKMPSDIPKGVTFSNSSPLVPYKVTTEKGWSDFGTNALITAPESVKNGSKLDQAKYIAAMVGEQMTGQGVVPNYSIPTRIGTGLSSSGTCGYTSSAIENALKGAGFTHTSTVYGQKNWLPTSAVDVNYAHNTTATVIDGKTYVFDVWKYGKDDSTGPEKNFKGFITSKYNGMSAEDWQKWMEKEGYMLFSAHQGDDRLYSGPEAAFEEYIEASNTQDAIKSSDYAKLAENFLKIKEGSEDLYKNKLDKFKKEHPDQYDKLVNAIKNKSALPKITDTKPPPEHAEHKDEKIPAVQTAAVPSSGKGRPGTAGTLNTPAPGKPQPPVDPTLITDEKGNLKPGYSIDKYGMAWSDKPSYILVKGPDGKWHDEIIKQTSAAAASTSGLSAPKQFPDAAQPPPPKTDAGNIQPYSYPPDFEYFLNMKWHGPNICQKGYDEIAQLLAKGNPDALNPFNTSYKANIIVEGQDHGIFYTVSDGKLQKVWTENPLDVNDPGITVWKMEGGRLVGIQGLKE